MDRWLAPVLARGDNDGEKGGSLWRGKFDGVVETADDGDDSRYRLKSTSSASVCATTCRRACVYLTTSRERS